MEDKSKRKALIITVAIAIIFVGFAAVSNCGCLKNWLNDWAEKTPIEKLEAVVIETEKVVKVVSKNLPDIKKEITTVCKVDKPPEWCKDAEGALIDAEDALEAMEIILAEARQAIELGDSQVSPSEIIGKIIEASFKLKTAYDKIEAIINRH